MVDVLTTSQDLQAFLDDIAGAPFVAVDTEFMREKTYYAELCLIQLASPEEAVVIDPLSAHLDIALLKPLMAAPETLKVFHAARQDVEIFVHRLGLVPTPLFDTQLAAMVCGYGDNVSYERLVAALAGGSIDKSARYVDWARRPLPERALTYALSDVTYLRDVYRRLAEQLESGGRTAWLAEEMGILTNPATYSTDPEEAWQRIKMRATKPRYLALMKAVAAWRERLAQKRNMPRQWVMKDETVQEIAATAPETMAQMEKVRGLNRGTVSGPAGDELLAAIARVKALPADQLPAVDRQEPPTNPGPVVELLKVLLKMRSEELGVAAKLIADTKELERLASGQRRGLAVLSDWRHQVFGADALRLLDGRLALAGLGRQVRVIDLDEAEPAATTPAASQAAAPGS